MVKSNRILPKYEKQNIRTEYSMKSLSKIEKVTSNSFHGEFSRIKRKSMGLKVGHKTKSISHKRLNDTIFRSLNDVKKVMNKRKDGEGESKNKNSKIELDSLQTITIDLPMSDSNKTKASMAESPPQFFPLDPEVVLSMYENQLSEFEKVELKEYKKYDDNFQIYFLGEIPSRKWKYEEEKYDDENGNYISKKGNNVYYRYEILSYIGKGSFGKVYTVYDHKEKEEIALKILKNFPKEENQIDLEPEILMFLKKNWTKNGTKLSKYHVIDIQEYFEFRVHKCFTMPIYEVNLYEKIKELNHTGFTVDIIRRISIQLLRCLKFLKENKVIHWDLKPENVLLKNKGKSGVVVIDYGSSCMDHQKLYAYIQSRFYRAPEILLGIPYSYPIDMWSLGWILVEMYIGVPLFDGRNEKEQMWLIMELRGIPPINLIENSNRREEFFDENLMPILTKDDKDKIIRPNSSSLAHFIEPQDKNFMKFIDACLHWDPDMRITPEEALRHDWILEGLPENIQISLQQ